MAERALPRAHIWVRLVSSCALCLSWSPEMRSRKEELIRLDSFFFAVLKD